MTVEQFRGTLGQEGPPGGLGLAQQALWWAGKGDWDRAHDCAQAQEGDPACDWVHAHLHRAEGDPENAAYWYGRVGRAPATGALPEAQTGAFCHGDSITMADICLASIKVVLPVFKIEVPNTPNVDRIYAACEAHAAFAKASPMRQVGAPA